MERATEVLWQRQERHPGDRWRLFRAVAGAVEARTVLYPGSYVDVAPSFVFDSVTYVDVDRRAARFFADRAGVLDIIGRHSGAPTSPQVSFLHADYRTDLDLPAASFDLLVSLYAGFVSEHCTRYLRPGGTLLVNPSHGDAAMAALDERFELSGVVVGGSGDYRVSARDLDSYLRPRRPVEITRESLHASGRGVAYTRSPFAYLFTRIA